MNWNLFGCYVPKARIVGVDINGCYLEAAIKIRTANACFVPKSDPHRMKMGGQSSATFGRSALT